MKTTIWIYGLLLLLFATGCDKERYDEPNTDKTDVTDEIDDEQVPEGYFVVRFHPSTSSAASKAAVNGQDSRVQHVRYILYKSSGEFVKEDVILSSSGSTTWPLPMIRDTLPKGSYKAVFLGNVEKTFFPYDTETETGVYNDILLNYQTSYSDARIELPPAEFSSNTEYYWANVSFSDTSANPNILLQRIIGAVQMQRTLVDAEDALDMLVDNLVEQINAGDIIQNTVAQILPSLIEQVLDATIQDILGTFAPINTPIVGFLLNPVLEQLTGLLDGLLNPLVQGLVGPIVGALNELLLQTLIDQLGNALAGNASKEALLEYLGVLLNPWNSALAHSVVVSIKDYPKAIDFELNSIDIHEGIQNFQHELLGDITEARTITLKTFAGSYRIEDIQAVGVGLVSGLVVGGLIDDFLLPGALVDITDTLQVTDSEANRRYLSSYSLLDLNTKNSVKDSTDNLTLSLKLGDIANIDAILLPILQPVLGVLIPLLESLTTLLSFVPGIGALVDGLVGDLENDILEGLYNLEIKVDLPINVSLLNINNLAITGSWGEPVPIP